MASSAKRLGRGLQSLISDYRPDGDEASPKTTTDPRGVAAWAAGQTPSDSPSLALLPVHRLEPNPFQPRDKISPESLASLARSIAESGVIQPVLVRPDAHGYQLIAGERRWRAAQAAGLERIPAIVLDVDDGKMLEMALVENIQREDLNAIDRAKAYRQFCQAFHLTPEQVAARTGEDRSTVTNYIRLLELPGEVRDLVAAGSLSMGHARALLGVDAPETQVDLAKAALNKRLSVRALEGLVRARKKPATAHGPDLPARVQSTHIRDLQDRFAQALGTKVEIVPGRTKHTGRIVIEYYSLDDFDRIADRLGVELEG